jgi:hypothetical protein
VKCPYCQVTVHPSFIENWVAQGGPISTEDGTKWQFMLGHMTCPFCGKAILHLLKRPKTANAAFGLPVIIYPRTANRPFAPPDVPMHLAKDFNEACLVLMGSPKASAALSRRCVQGLLNDQGFTSKTLARAIEGVLSSKTLPAALANSLDAIRNIGNFATHPIKDTTSGVIVYVEDHEADWNLDVLEGLFDFYYVQPAKNAARREALNSKLRGTDRPPMR